MNKRESDIQIWETIINFYKKYCPVDEWEKRRQKNQLEAYWCRPDGEKQNLFQKPCQRIFARLIKSYQNTTWHQIQLSDKNNEKYSKDPNRRNLITDPWFECEDIIKMVEGKYNANDIQGEGFRDFCETALNIVKDKEFNNLKNYDFSQEQGDNFSILQKVISKVFYDKNELKVSAYEKIFYETLDEPYQTIMKMQKLLSGLGIALTCDFLKESHLCNIAKPDVHICHVFSVIDRIPYSMDLALVKRVAEFAQNVCPPVEDHFCESGAYCVDKIIWMICSKGKKKELLDALR